MIGQKRIRDDFRLRESGLQGASRLPGPGPVLPLSQRRMGRRDADFWLCGQCCRVLTLEYQDGAGVLTQNRGDVVRETEISQFIAVA